MLELLPTESAEWTGSLIREQGAESDAVYVFQGQQYAHVPDQMKASFAGNFSIHFWLQHRSSASSSANSSEHVAPLESASRRHTKEQILCLADDHQKNRQHMSVFVRNCRLVLLLRREASSEGIARSTIFRPAEWRWQLPQVCDGRWHHYAFNVRGDSNSPSVQLWVDGSAPSDAHLPHKHLSTETVDVVDDWPLHRLPGVNTTLSVGACWAGGLGLYRQPLHGALAGLAVLSGAHESTAVLRCLNRCRERLVAPTDLNDLRSIGDSIARSVVPTVDSLLAGRGEADAGEHVRKWMQRLQRQQANTDQNDPVQVWQSLDGSKIRLFAANALEIEDALSQISYENDRTYPTPGRRNIRIDSQLICADGRRVRLQPSKLNVLVEPIPAPEIRLNGTNNLAREYEAFGNGVRLFESLQISINGEPAIDTSNSLRNVLSSDSSSVRSDDSARLGEATAAGGESWNSPAEIDSDEPIIDAERVPIRDRNDDTDDLKSAVEAADWTNLSKLDACQLQVYPPLNPEHEHVRLPSDLMQRLNVRAAQTADALRLRGVHAAVAYQTLLRQIVYVNRKPAYYLSRAFKLTCSDLAGRFVSNEYVQTLTVIHPKATTTSTESTSSTLNDGETRSAHSSTHNPPVVTAEPSSASSSSSSLDPEVVDPIPQVHHVIGSDSTIVARMLAHPQHISPKAPQIKAGTLMESTLLEDGFSRTSASMFLSDFFRNTTSFLTIAQTNLHSIGAGHAVTVIIVVCVAFLVFMIVLGVIRIRAAHHRSENRDDEPEMAWDDSSLTITVNPLDVSIICRIAKVLKK